MKNLILILIAALSLSANAVEREGHGGDDVVWEFQQTGHAITSWLVFHGYRITPATLHAEDFKATLAGAAIFSTDDILPDDRVAYNYPAQNMIRINRRRWNRIRNDKTRWGLVLHEVLPLMKRPDDDGAYSNRVANLAFPGKGSAVALASLPTCRKEVALLPMPMDGRKPYLGLDLERAKRGYSVYFVAGELDASGKETKQTRVALAEQFRCSHSTLHPEIMDCGVFNSAKSIYLDRNAEPKQHATTLRMVVKSALVSDLYRKGSYLLLEELHAQGTEVTWKKWQEVEQGKLPVFKTFLSWEQATEYAGLGVDRHKAFGDTFTLDFVDTDCFWTPQP